MCYDGLFLGRIDYQDKMERLTHKNGEMVWKASDSLSSSDLFTGVLYNTYSPPPGFCFDILCADEPIVDDRNSPEYNVDKKVILKNWHVSKKNDSHLSHNVKGCNDSLNWHYLFFKS